jgi:hypothetical protein
MAVMPFKAGWGSRMQMLRCPAMAFKPCGRLDVLNCRNPTWPDVWATMPFPQAVHSKWRRKDLTRRETMPTAQMPRAVCRSGKNDDVAQLNMKSPSFTESAEDHY